MSWKLRCQSGALWTIFYDRHNGAFHIRNIGYRIEEIMGAVPKILKAIYDSLAFAFEDKVIRVTFMDL